MPQNEAAFAAPPVPSPGRTGGTAAPAPSLHGPEAARCQRLHITGRLAALGLTTAVAFFAATAAVTAQIKLANSVPETASPTVAAAAMAAPPPQPTAQDVVDQRAASPPARASAARASAGPLATLGSWQPLMEVIVGPGDSLNVLALEYDTTVTAIVAYNDLEDGDRIQPGQRLIIPVGFSLPLKLAR